MERSKRQRFLPDKEPPVYARGSFPGLNKQLAAAIAGSTLGLGILGHLGGILPWFGPYSSAAIAAMFLFLPSVMSRIFSNKWDVAPYDMSFRSSNLTSSICIIGCIFLVYITAFFFWQNVVHGSGVDFSCDRMADWDLQTRWNPEQSPGRSGLVAGSLENGDWVVANRSSEVRVIEVRVTGAARTAVAAAERATGRSADTSAGSLTLDPGETLRVSWVGSGGGLSLGSPLGIVVGDGDEISNGSWSRSYWWILWFIIIQIILVAIPEEFFYRGFLQPRLQAAAGSRVVFWRGDIGWGILATSVVFAVGHLVTVPSLHRLAVFFPSIMFGWLKDRSGSLLMPVLVHALSNILMAILYRFTV